MDREPRWLTSAETEEINHLVVARTGEPYLLRSQSLLDGAVARPYNLWVYEGVVDLFALAARLVCGIGQNHPFEQGNKRAALLAGIGFLGFNGFEITLTDLEEAGLMVEAMIIGAAPESALADLLRAHAEPDGPPRDAS